MRPDTKSFTAWCLGTTAVEYSASREEEFKSIRRWWDMDNIRKLVQCLMMTSLQAEKKIYKLYKVFNTEPMMLLQNISNDGVLVITWAAAFWISEVFVQQRFESEAIVGRITIINLRVWRRTADSVSASHRWIMLCRWSPIVYLWYKGNHAVQDDNQPLDLRRRRNYWIVREKESDFTHTDVATTRKTTTRFEKVVKEPGLNFQ